MLSFPTVISVALVSLLGCLSTAIPVDVFDNLHRQSSLAPTFHRPLAPGEPFWYRDAVGHDKIVGGTPYSETQYSDTVPNFYARLAIMVSPFYENPASCGASVIGRDILVSAAHCVKFENVISFLPLSFMYIPELFLHIHIGATDSDMKGTEIAIDEIYHPEGYDPSKRDDDIIVIRLQTPIPDDVYEPLAMAPAPASGGLGYTFAMGLSDSEMQASDFRVLRLAELDIQPYGACTYGDLCTKTLSTTSGGLCTHDSGSPLLVVQDGEFVLIGISRSASPVDCVPTMKTHYYTDIAPYLDDLYLFTMGNVPQGWVKYSSGAIALFS